MKAYTFSPNRGATFLLALLFVAPFTFIPFHTLIPTFYGEWLAIVLGLTVAAILLVSFHCRPFHLPRVALLPLSLAILIGLQSVFRPEISSGHALMAMLYLLWATLLICVGYALQRQSGELDLADSLAWALLAGGIWNCLAEWVNRQVGLTTGLGTIGQTNNYADYLSLAGASLIYLRGRAKLSLGLATALLLLLAIGLCASSSRSVWFYLAALLALAWYGRRYSSSSDAVRRVLVSTVLLFLFYFAGQLVIPLVQKWGLWQGSTSAQYFVNSAQGASPRLHIWKVAWDIFLEFPWLGSGFGQFDWNYFFQGQYHPKLQLRVEHAHNIVLHLMAELGLVSVLIVAALFIPWCQRIARASWQPHHFWMSAFIAIVGIHSLLEYPLWYAYFLGPTAVVLGMGESRSFTINTPWLVRLGLIGLLCIGVFAAFNTLENYRLLDRTSLMKDRTAIVELAHKIRANSPLMAPYAELTEAVVLELNRQNLEEKIALTDKAMRFWPANHLVFHQTAFLAWSGREAEANKLLTNALAVYPKWALLYAKNIRLMSKEDRHALGTIETRLRSVMPEICRIHAPELISQAPECAGNFD